MDSAPGVATMFPGLNFMGLLFSWESKKRPPVYERAPHDSMVELGLDASSIPAVLVLADGFFTGQLSPVRPQGCSAVQQVLELA